MADEFIGADFSRLLRFYLAKPRQYDGKSNKPIGWVHFVQRMEQPPDHPPIKPQLDPEGVHPDASRILSGPGPPQPPHQPNRAAECADPCCEPEYSGLAENSQKRV